MLMQHDMSSDWHATYEILININLFMYKFLETLNSNSIYDRWHSVTNLLFKLIVQGKKIILYTRDDLKYLQIKNKIL